MNNKTQDELLELLRNHPGYKLDPLSFCELEFLDAAVEAWGEDFFREWMTRGTK